MKIVLGGPPRSGKSCLRQGLKDAVRRIPGAPYPYVITACPDGEGAWFQETVANDPELAARLKAAYKSRFTDAFVERVAVSVRNCTETLTIVDVGGIPDAFNETICKHATHAILLAGDPARLPEWREFCSRVNLRILAEIHSDYDGLDDVVDGEDRNGVFRGSVHHLERGEDVSRRPLVEALARHVVRLVGIERSAMPLSSAGGLEDDTRS